MNKSDSLSLVQGQSTVTCMIVNYLSQLPHWLHQVPTVGGQCNHKPAYWVLLQVWKKTWKHSELKYSFGILRQWIQNCKKSKDFLVTRGEEVWAYHDLFFSPATAHSSQQLDGRPVLTLATAHAPHMMTPKEFELWKQQNRCICVCLSVSFSVSLCGS